MKILLKKDALTHYMQINKDDPYSLAKRMSVAPSTIYRILKGDRGVGSEFIPKLLRAFNLSEKDFDKLFIFSSELPKSNKGDSS